MTSERLLLQLPIYTRVVCHLAPHDIIAIARTCKEYHNIFTSHIVWQNVRADLDELLTNLVIGGGNIEMTKMLIKIGAKPGRYSIIHTINNWNIQLLQTVNNGVDIWNMLKILIASADKWQLDDLLSMNLDCRYELIKCLLDNGANPNAEHGMPLYNAVLYGNIDILKALLDAGAYKSQLDQLLVYNVVYCGLKVVNLLLDAGANPNADSGSPLYSAFRTGLINIVSVLLDAGADPNLVQEHGRSPLYGAAFMGHTAVVKLLLKHGAVVTNDAVQAAFKNHHLSAFRVLAKARDKLKRLAGKDNAQIPS